MKNHLMMKICRALTLAPEDASLLADSGLFAVQMGRVKKGLGQLRRAIARAPEDLGIVQDLIEALCEARQYDEAQRELQLARFRHGHNARFAKIARDLEFRQLRHQQRQATTSVTQGKAVLPFLRVHFANGTKSAKRWIAHGRSASRPHFPRVRQSNDTSKVP